MVAFVSSQMESELLICWDYLVALRAILKEFPTQIIINTEGTRHFKTEMEMSHLREEFKDMPLDSLTATPVLGPPMHVFLKEVEI